MTFDLEKAREIAAFMIVHNCYGGERFADTLAEVERLRADLRNCSAYVGIGPGEGDLPIPERVRRTVNRLNGSVHRYEQKILAKDVQIRSLKIEETNLCRQIEQLEAEIEELKGDLETAKSSLKYDREEIKRLRGEMENYGDDYVCQMKSKDARIAELEEALVEERAKIVCYDQDSTDEWWNDLSENGSLGKGKNEIRREAREQLQAEGKIGPDAKQHDHTAEFFRPNESPAKSWQITDERKAAILHCKRMLTFLKEDDAPCYDVEKITKDESVLVAMLEEVGQ